MVIKKRLWQKWSASRNKKEFTKLLFKFLWNQRPDLSIRETNEKIVLHILPFFELIPRDSWLNTVYQRLWKSCPASSSKNSQTKTDFHVFCLVELITADASFWTPFTQKRLWQHLVITFLLLFKHTDPISNIRRDSCKRRFRKFLAV